MYKQERWRNKYPGLVIILLILLIIPSALFGEDKEIKAEKEVNADFDLTVEDDLISLKAKDASLRKIMEEIGSKMVIDVVGKIAEEEKVSVEFDGLSLKDALEKLSASYGYVMDAEDGGEKVTKIIILPKGKETSIASSATRKPKIQKREGSKKSVKPEPFKFEFDPSKSMK